MSSQGLRVVWRAEAQGSARSKQIDRQLTRFRPEVNRAVRALAARHTRLADLAESFPALAVTLAFPGARVMPGAIMAAVVAGWPLEDLASAAHLPVWSRRLPPECFAGAVPYLPQSPDFFRRIANHLPKPRAAAGWLKAVSFAAEWGGEAFAVWMARTYQPEQKNRRRRPRDLSKVLALWAFASSQPGSLAHALIDRPWNPSIGRRAALGAACTWWDGVELYVRMGDALVGDPWLTPGEVDGYRFEPLLSAGEILEEARAMKNCLRTFGRDITQNYARLWSIRKDGRRIATVEIHQPWAAQMLNVCQLHARANRHASAPVWWAAQQWLHRHDLPGLVKRIAPAAPLLDGCTWRKLWKPFWMARGRVPQWLPLAPSENVLDAF